MSLVTTGTAVPGLYSHITHSVDKDEAEIPPPFKGAKPKQTRGRGKPNHIPMITPIIITIMIITLPQHFQDSEKMYQLDPEANKPVPDINSLYPYINNDIEYGLFEDIVDSYYLDSQIKDDFHCDQDCYTQQQEPTVDNHSISCTHAYNHIVQQIQDLSDSTQQYTLHSMEENASLFTNDSTTPCDFNITNQNSDTDKTNDTNISNAPNNLTFIHKANTNIETLLANQIYNTMILTIKMHSHLQINTRHYYNKN